MLGHDDCAALDARDVLAPVRERFLLPEGVTYLDGNSLGALSEPARRSLLDTVDGGWGRRLIAGWFEEGWLDAPARVGDRIGALVGAAPGQVLVSDTTTVNVFKLASAALALRPGAVVIPRDDFPTDRYVLEGLAAREGRELRMPEPDRVADAIDGGVALAVLSHVDYRTARIADMAGITARAHDAGALVLWDLCHSAGALPVALDQCGVDLAAGCTYKFLSGGPGAPAFVYAARRHQERLRSPIQGWFGQGDQFDFGEGYAPARGVQRFLTGTTGMLGLAALDGALDVWDGVAMDDVRAKSAALGDTLIQLVDERCAGLGVGVASPRDASRRGSHVALRHPRAGTLARRLAARGVVTDFRPPDLIRCGLTPLYTRFTDVWTAVDALREELHGLP